MIYFLFSFKFAPDYKYGVSCSKNCKCNTSNTISCDGMTGVCKCKPAWSGETCECRSGRMCDAAYSFL